ncbi:hypothetical protein B0H10DRAFT_1970885 [Mycena sp. CBHHK59/15]|nr:hypothetical protein B0H10DRAFT_1970885 [Mycena sp. CBHHK59/15]
MAAVQSAREIWASRRRAWSDSRGTSRQRVGAIRALGAVRVVSTSGRRRERDAPRAHGHTTVLARWGSATDSQRTISRTTDHQELGLGSCAVDLPPAAESASQSCEVGLDGTRKWGKGTYHGHGYRGEGDRGRSAQERARQHPLGTARVALHRRCRRSVPHLRAVAHARGPEGSSPEHAQVVPSAQVSRSRRTAPAWSRVLVRVPASPLRAPLHSVGRRPRVGIEEYSPSRPHARARCGSSGRDSARSTTLIRVLDDTDSAAHAGEPQRARRDRVDGARSASAVHGRGQAPMRMVVGTGKDGARVCTTHAPMRCGDSTGIELAERVFGARFLVQAMAQAAQHDIHAPVDYFKCKFCFVWDLEDPGKDQLPKTKCDDLTIQG